MVGSLKMNTALEYSTRVVQEGDRRCKKSTLNDLAYLTPLRIPLMNPVLIANRKTHKIFLPITSNNSASVLNRRYIYIWAKGKKIATFFSQIYPGWKNFSLTRS